MTFVLLAVASVGSAFARLPSTLFARLDPLVGLGAMVASRAWIGFWATALVTVIASVLLGRVWCGWLCPMGTLLDVVPALGRIRLPRWTRAGKYVLAAIVVGGALLGTLGPMVLDPLTVLTRPLQELLRPYMGTDAVGLATGALVSRGAVSSVAVLSLVPLGALLALNAVSRRFWCTALCPLGGLLAVISHAPGFRRVVDRDSCRSCGSCAKRCPMGAIRPDKDFSSETGECIACGTCIDECRFGALGFHVTLPGRGAFAHDPDRRSAVLAAGTAAAGLVVVATPVLRPRPDIPDPVLDGPILRPPSTDDARLAQLCVRCGACYGACPTGALHPSLSLSNPAGPWTPMLDVRPLHCTLNCNRCAGVCPTDALHTPTAEEAVALGLGVVASIDTRRCRAWARNKTCLLCVGVCPISGALTAVDRPPGLPTFRRVPVQVPRVDRNLCVGCNVCSGACPVQPPAIATDLQRVPVPSGPTIPQMMGVEPLDD